MKISESLIIAASMGILFALHPDCNVTPALETVSFCLGGIVTAIAWLITQPAK